MTDYYSNTVKILGENTIIEISQPNNIPLFVNYGEEGDSIVLLGSTNSERQSTCFVTIINSSLVPEIEWRYLSEGQWLSVPETFSFSNQLVDNTWVFTMTVPQNLNLSVWGNRSFKAELNNLEDFENENTVLFTPHSQSIQFIMNWGNPPELSFTVQPQDTQLSSSGAEFSLEFRSYFLNPVSGWEFSDDHDDSNPQNASWDNYSSGFTTSSSTMGDLSSIGYGIIGVAPEFLYRYETLFVPYEEYVPDRCYRFKVVNPGGF
jgi:hypothetical protein